MSQLRDAAIAIVKKQGLEYRDPPFQLASGEFSHDYMDGKKALAEGHNLALACRAIIELAAESGAEFDCVGGLTLGADSFAHGIALLESKRWFVVRKKAKEHGKAQLVEGAQIAKGNKVLLIDDVVTTGGSILEALDAVQDRGAAVTLAVTLVDRGEQAAKKFADRGIAYQPLMTYKDLGIKPVGQARTAAAT